MIIEIPSTVWTALLLAAVTGILIVLIMIYRTLKNFGNYNDPDEGQIKLHFRDFGKKG